MNMKLDKKLCAHLIARDEFQRHDAIVVAIIRRKLDLSKAVINGRS